MVDTTDGPGGKRALEAANGGDDGEQQRAKRAHTDAAPRPDTVLQLLVPAEHLAVLQGPKGDGGGGDLLDAAARDTESTVRLISETPGCDERLVVIYSPVPEGGGGAEAGGLVGGAWAALQRLAGALLAAAADAAAAGGGGGGSGGGEEPARPRRRRVRLLVSGCQAASLTASDSAALAEVEGGSGVQIEVQAAERAPTCACAGERVAELSGEGHEPLLAALARLSAHLERRPARRRPRGVSEELKATIELAEAAAADGAEG